MGVQDRYDLIVVGSGFCGSIIARLAADMGKRVRILERRGHIAGNMYDEVDENGILIHKYGPHIFHTDEDWIYQFLSRFAYWHPYRLIYGVELDGKYIPAPFGFKAIRMLYPKREAEELINRLKDNYPDRENIPVLDLMESTDEKIAALAEMLYEKDYRPYAAKQWNLDPRELDKSVVARMPVLLSEREHYFDTKYELMPDDGYTAFFERMLDHESIDVLLNTDACDYLDFDIGEGTCRRGNEKLEIPIVFTGTLEDLFDSTDPLPYRSLYFEEKTLNCESYQPTFIMTYPQAYDYIRTTEYSKITKAPPKGKTVVAFEYSVPYQKGAPRGGEPYYPILKQEYVEKNNSYVQRLKSIPNVIPCGRLADYKYYNMDQAVMRAFDVFETVKKALENKESI